MNNSLPEIPVQSCVLVPQLAYGKAVERSGDIVRGSEHGITAKSKIFPKGLARLCHPSVVGLGGDVATSWRQNPWKQGGGGLVTRPVSDGNQRYMLVGRVAARPEFPGRAHSRLFYLARYVAIPIEYWTPVPLYWLVENLRAVPTERGEDVLPELEFPFLQTCAQETDRAWTRVGTDMRGVLGELLSGAPVVLDGRELTMYEMAGLMIDVLDLLPRALVESMPLGLGVLSATGDWALAVGKPTARKRRRDASEPKREKSGRLVKMALEQQSTIAGRAESALGVLLAEYGAGAPSRDDMGWRDRVQELHNALAQRDRIERLDAWLTGRAGAESMSLGQTGVHPGTLRTVVSCMNEKRVGTLLEESTGAQWEPMWWQLVETGDMDATALARLLGLAGTQARVRAEDVRRCWGVPLHGALAERVVTAVAAAMWDPRDATQWVELTRGKLTGRDAGWPSLLDEYAREPLMLAYLRVRQTSTALPAGENERRILINRFLSDRRRPGEPMRAQGTERHQREIMERLGQCLPEAMGRAPMLRGLLLDLVAQGERLYPWNELAEDVVLAWFRRQRDARQLAAELSPYQFVTLVNLAFGSGRALTRYDYRRLLESARAQAMLAGYNGDFFETLGWTRRVWLRNKVKFAESVARSGRQPTLSWETVAGYVQACWEGDGDGRVVGNRRW